MWMKHDQNKENSVGRPINAGLLQCPMCKGRGYFEPTGGPITKNFQDFTNDDSEIQADSHIKLPQLEIKPKIKQCMKARSKYSLPNINNVKNLPENKSVDYTDCDEVEDKQEIEVIRNFKSTKVDTKYSHDLSASSSNDSSIEKTLIPSPHTPKNPFDTMKISLMKLKTNNWNEAVNALRSIVQLSRYHRRLVEPNMVVVYRGLIHLLKSFRSIVVRTACQASNELFATMANTQRPEFDEIISVLLQKTADTNKFVRQDANEALDTMVINIPPNHSVRTIVQKGIPHKSPVVRSSSVRLLVCAVGVVGVDAIFGGNKETRGRIVSAAATCMQDGCQDVRGFGRRLMKMLMQHEDFEDVLQTEVNEILLKRIEKNLITMKYKIE